MNSLHPFFFRESKRIYTVAKKISAGGYGAVYKVKDERGGGTYALKEELREQNQNHYKYKLFMEVQVGEGMGEGKYSSKLKIQHYILPFLFQGS
jgi:hypothetical protein